MNYQESLEATKHLTKLELVKFIIMVLYRMDTMPSNDHHEISRRMARKREHLIDAYRMACNAQKSKEAL